ncbi:MAG: ESX secretion-associated protein EspG [Rhodococcus sp.]|nr:ESX secretion-associated protein EspG [Rhodococcus sp. (in: high G+C Gram-positive bacteria)]
MDFLVDKLSLDVLPVVLDANPRHETADDRDAAFRQAAETLTERDLLHHDTVDQNLTDWLRVVARPTWEIALRWHVAGDVSRMCVSHTRDLSISVMRAGETFVVQECGADLFAPIVRALGTAQAAKFQNVNAPTADLSAAFDDAMDGANLADKLTRLGVPTADAGPLGRAVYGCDTYAEIVGIAYGDGQYDPVGGPVTVFDTDFGRIVGTSSVSAHGVAWSSLSPGSPQRLRQALEALADRLEQ